MAARIDWTLSHAFAQNRMHSNVCIVTDDLDPSLVPIDT